MKSLSKKKKNGYKSSAEKPSIQKQKNKQTNKQKQCKKQNKTTTKQKQKQILVFHVRNNSNTMSNIVSMMHDACTGRWTITILTDFNSKSYTCRVTDKL